MSKMKIINRRLVVLGSFIIQLCSGTIYAWSVFTTPLVFAGWSRYQTQSVFAAGLATFAIFMVIAGRIIPKLGPRLIAMAGGIILGLGYILCGLIGKTDFNVIFILIGIVGCAGAGAAYVVSIAVGISWFPDKKGMVTGLALTGFSLGSLLWVKLAGSWGQLLHSYGLSETFIIYGNIYILCVFIGSRWMKYPPEEWKPSRWITMEEKGSAKLTGTVNFPIEEMLKSLQYYLIFFAFIFVTGAGLISIGLMKLFPMEALINNGFDENAASAIAGTAMVVFYSFANVIGRIVWGAISDYYGRKRSLIIIMSLQSVVIIAFPVMAATPKMLYLGATLIGSSFGGNIVLFSTVTADAFGDKYLAQNYGWIFLAYAIGGIFGPMLGGYLGDMGNFALAFVVCGSLFMVSVMLITRLKPMKKKSK